MILRSLRALLFLLLAAAASMARAGEPSWLVLCLDRSGSIGPAAIADMKAALVQALVDGAPSQLNCSLSHSWRTNLAAPLASSPRFRGRSSQTTNRHR